MMSCLKAVELVNSNSLIDLGKRARNFVEKNNWDSVIDAFESLLIDAVQKKNQR